jgi:hypothetical protein
MSNCTFCGAVEYWHAVEEGAEFTPYCPNCHPPETVVLPLDVGKDWDIDESEIPGMPAPVQGSPSLTGHHLNNSNPPAPAHSGIYTPNSNDIVFTVDDPSHPTSLNIEGSEVLTAYEELPDTAEQGKIAFKKGEDTAYVYDGEEWQNLGEALLGKKRSTLTHQDEKIDRRAAIKATKEKNNAE